MYRKILIETIKNNVLKILVNEAKSDRVIKNIQRFVVNQFKQKTESSEEFILQRAGEEVPILVKVSFDEIKDFNHPFSIDAGSEWDEIDILIEYRPDAFPKHMNELVSELKETIEHEMVHVLQTFFEDEYVPFENHENNLEYLISAS